MEQRVAKPVKYAAFLHYPFQMPKSYRTWLALVWLLGHAALASAISDAPLQALSSYIENAGNCSQRVVDWNREYAESTMRGETSRDFYYRVLGFQDWGGCSKPYFRSILGELRKAWVIFARGNVSEAEFEAKEAELINLFFAALEDDKRGAQIVRAYEARTAGRLINLDLPRQYSNCTFFGDQPRCMD